MKYLFRRALCGLNLCLVLITYNVEGFVSKCVKENRNKDGEFQDPKSIDLFVNP